MYKVYYEMGDDNQPAVRDYKNLKWALRFAHKQQNNPKHWLGRYNQLWQ